MPYYVCKGAKLKCSMGSDQSDLGVMHPVNPVHLCGNPMASIMDHKPMMNIMPFGQCQSLANPVVAAATAAANGKLQKMPCIPNTASPWMPGKMNVLVKGQPALLETDKCMCMWAGVIEIANPGQNKVRTISGSVDGASPSAGASGSSQASPGTGAVTQVAAASQSAYVASTNTLIKKVEGATDVYSKQEIKYRVSGYNKDKREVSEAEKQSIRWAVNVDGKITELAGKRGEEIVLDMPDEWAGKAIRVMACFHSFKQDVSQEVKVGPLSDKILIRMAGGASKASPGQEVEYKVTRYNVDSVIPEFGKLIKWAVKVDGKQEEQACNGETVTIKMKDSWLGKEIVVMPYLNAPTENVSVRTMVGTQSTLSIVEIKGVDKTYPRQRITYKVTKYNKEEYEMNEEDIEQIKKIKWAVRAGNNIKNLEDNEGNEFIGERIFLDINKELEGCYIFVMAYIENTEKASFKTEILRDSFSGTLIRGVEGEDEAFIGQTKTYKVLNSNKDGEAGEVSDGSDVKWAIKVGKNGNMDKSELENMRGEKIIYIKMKPEWAGKEIIIMPYLNSPTEIVSVKTEVMGGNLRAKLGETHYKAVKAIFEKTPNSAAIFRKFENELFVKKINTPVKDVEYDDINKELNLNIEADKAGIDEELKPYERTIHEIWHHIDHLAGGPDSKTFFSQSYKDELAKAAKIDFLNKVEININAINNDNATQEDYDKIAELVGEEAYFLSYKDIIAAITNGAVDYQTHPKSYWNDQTIPAEIFANIAAAKIANDEAFIVIKNKLPKIIEVYNKMLNDMRESNSSEAV